MLPPAAGNGWVELRRARLLAVRDGLFQDLPGQSQVGWLCSGGKFPPAGPLLPCLRALLIAQVWEGAGNPAHPLPDACSVPLKEARSSSALVALWRSGGRPRRLGTAFPKALARACFGCWRHAQLLPGAQLSTVSPGLRWRQQGEPGPFCPCCQARRAAVLLRCHGCAARPGLRAPAGTAVSPAPCSG